MTRIAALVPMRHHSQRVPGKNYRPLAGKPLFPYIMEPLREVDQLDEVVVNTDSDVIKKGLRHDFPDVRIIDRPPGLAGDKVSMNTILAYDVQMVEADYYLQTHSTNPLLTADSISRALETFLAIFPENDSLFSVTPLQTRLWSQDGKPLNHDPDLLIQTQDLPPVYEENSCLYLFTKEILLERSNRLGGNPLLFEIDPLEAWDIDTELDFLICEQLMKKRKDET
jgi:CMP-N-acetylneuraminic acid synthetase